MKTPFSQRKPIIKHVLVLMQKSSGLSSSKKGGKIYHNKLFIPSRDAS